MDHWVKVAAVLLPEGDNAVFPAFASDPDRAGFRTGQIASAETDDFGDTSPGVVHHGEQHPVPSTGPRRVVRGILDRLHLLARQVAKQRPGVALCRDGEHATSQWPGRRFPGCGVLHERAHGRQTGVAGARAIAPVGLEMVQERQDDRGVEVSQDDRRDWLAQVLREVGQQQPEGVAVGFDRARADTLLLDQATTEEVLDQGVEGGRHGTPPSSGAANCSNRWPAMASNSGTPVRYQ